MLGIISPPDWNRVSLKFMFFKKATKFDEIFTIDLRYVVSVKSTVKISSIFVAFLENMNFIYQNLGGDGPLVPPLPTALQYRTHELSRFRRRQLPAGMAEGYKI